MVAVRRPRRWQARTNREQEVQERSSELRTGKLRLLDEAEEKNMRRKKRMYPDRDQRTFDELLAAFYRVWKEVRYDRKIDELGDDMRQAAERGCLELLSPMQEVVLAHLVNLVEARSAAMFEHGVVIDDFFRNLACEFTDGACVSSAEMR